MDTNPYFGGGVSPRVVGRDGKDLRDRRVPWDSSNNSGCDLLIGTGKHSVHVALGRAGGEYEGTATCVRSM